MFSFFKSDPKAKIQKEIDKLYEKAMQFQRKGDLREYSKLIQSIEELEKKKELLG